jgi:2-(1,2-epoxy-1,2-dihydrophenyl)acetyl-CoA isomerase
VEAFAFECVEGVARIRLARGDRGNPFDQTMTSELSLIASDCIRRPDVRAALIEAEGRFFSVGGDLGTLGASREVLTSFIETGTAGLHMGVSRIARMDAPVVAAVHALAAGGAVSLLAACDFVVAARSARFYAAYGGIGLAIDGGGSYFLPRRVGTRRAASFYLRNETWSAEQAYEYGLVTEVVDDDALQPTAERLAAELAAGPTRSFGEMKRLLLSTWDAPLEAQLEAEARAMARAVQTDDCWNAITSVARKATPTFRGA